MVSKFKSYMLDREAKRNLTTRQAKIKKSNSGNYTKCWICEQLQTGTPSNCGRKDCPFD